MNFLILQIPKINDSLIKDTSQLSKDLIEGTKKTINH